LRQFATTDEAKKALERVKIAEIKRRGHDFSYSKVLLFLAELYDQTDLPDPMTPLVSTSRTPKKICKMRQFGVTDEAKKALERVKKAEIKRRGLRKQDTGHGFSYSKVLIFLAELYDQAHLIK
jgi:hypothetical protein